MPKIRFILFLLVLAGLVLAGCGRNVDVAAFSATSEAQAAEANADAATAVPDETDSDTAAADEADADTGATTEADEDAAGADGGDAAGDASLVGNPANGEVLYNQLYPEAGFACVSCHYPDQETRLVGPGLLNIGTRAATRVEGESAVEYIHNAIVNPGAYVVDGYPDLLMPQIYAELFNEDEINDLVAYLLTFE